MTLNPRQYPAAEHNMHRYFIQGPSPTRQDAVLRLDETGSLLNATPSRIVKLYFDDKIRNKYWASAFQFDMDVSETRYCLPP